jgi:hypothetical protein
VPYLNEEILVLRVGDTASESGAMRWWSATIIEHPIFRVSMTRRRTSVNSSLDGPVLQVLQARPLSAIVAHCRFLGSLGPNRHFPTMKASSSRHHH